jgi:hypothetical protein
MSYSLVSENMYSAGIEGECQLGCFKVEKTAWNSQYQEPANLPIVEQIEAVLATGLFTSSSAFDIAVRMKVRLCDIG